MRGRRCAVQVANESPGSVRVLECIIKPGGFFEVEVMIRVVVLMQIGRLYIEGFLVILTLRDNSENAADSYSFCHVRSGFVGF